MQWLLLDPLLFEFHQTAIEIAPQINPSILTSTTNIILTVVIMGELLSSSPNMKSMYLIVNIIWTINTFDELRTTLY